MADSHPPRQQNGEQRAFQDTFVYQPEEDLSPFAAFLAHTNEKDTVGSYLGNIISTYGVQKKIRILDIGCGDGSLACTAIAASGVDATRIDYEGIEPVPYNAHRAQNSLSERGITSVIHKTGFEGSQPSGAYDVIIASNLYHLATAEVPAFLIRVQKLLSQQGVALFVYRADRDDILDFRYKFEAPLYDDFRVPRTIGHIVSACRDAGFAVDDPSEIRSQLRLPEDALLRSKIIEFILNMPVDAIDSDYLGRIESHFWEHQNTMQTAQAILQIRSATSN